MSVAAAAIQRLSKEKKKIDAARVCDFYAAPLPDNLFEWHFTLMGPADSVYAGGLYHGILRFPRNYPFSPPDILFLTQSGRFEVETRICSSVSSFHPELWQPSYDIALVLIALRAFMAQDEDVGVGALMGRYVSAEEKRRLAAASRNFTCGVCGMRRAEEVWAAEMRGFPPVSPEVEASVPKLPRTTPEEEEKEKRNNNNNNNNNNNEEKEEKEEREKEEEDNNDNNDNKEKEGEGEEEKEKKEEGEMEEKEKEKKGREEEEEEDKVITRGKEEEEEEKEKKEEEDTEVKLNGEMGNQQEKSQLSPTQMTLRRREHPTPHNNHNNRNSEAAEFSPQLLSSSSSTTTTTVRETVRDNNGSNKAVTHTTNKEKEPPQQQQVESTSPTTTTTTTTTAPVQTSAVDDSFIRIRLGNTVILRVSLKTLDTAIAASFFLFSAVLFKKWIWS
ncbi:putative ubiquitin-conjugating enzyme [Trypanosoma theileri]|uniref:Putative ubiquitin-conjugating enzyme n=1 Tax=Trypanosoma theileri TaxID=67003 RepID=A0A1X0NK06_9TRYP|nr:putative ubiquitin-conjugating enzyme [Trypanosoma theileri]ORC85082.1 putative ubiquitin-conjugating enzyme [Trypanosoma theileri]